MNAGPPLTGRLVLGKVDVRCRQMALQEVLLTLS